MTQYTGPGRFGYPLPYNDADFTTGTLVMPAVGQWTGPGRFGYPLPYNDSDFTTGPVTPGDSYVLKAFTLSAVLDFEITPFDRVDHLVPLDGEMLVATEFPAPFESAADVDDISVTLRESYSIAVMWT